MELILLQDVQGLGTQFSTVNVKPGYGRNYLLPQKMAIIANKANKAMAAEKMKQLTRKRERMVAEIETLVARLKVRPIQVGAKVGTTDKIFGSVTNVQLAEAIKAQTGIEIDRRKLSISDDVKTLGNYTATVDFGDGLHYDITFEVVAE